MVYDQVDRKWAGDPIRPLTAIRRTEASCGLTWPSHPLQHCIFYLIAPACLGREVIGLVPGLLEDSVRNGVGDNLRTPYEVV